MLPSTNIFRVLLFIILLQIVTPGFSQLGISFDIKKPEQFDDRVLGSEKTDTKKFTLPRRLIQNTFTHYNYFFNANNELNQVIEQAKTQHQDDYNELLSFYNYSLDATSRNKILLDSIISRSTTGIVLHDLRNDWIDNMYLLMGAAYYLRKQFDTAYLTFQFINYAFAEKEKDGYYRTIGSRLDGNNAFTISTKEKESLTRRVFSQPPSRNDAFIWQIRTLIAMEEYAEAASLIVTLKNDPVFPDRLKNELNEVQAWWFYRNNMYDSAAAYLSIALKGAPTKKEKARWEFLTAQLYELAGKTEMAKSFYEKVIAHTVDPVMEIYARLRSIRINKEGGENYVDRNIADLLKMAKRDKYRDYRDVIYYTLAQMEMDRNNYDAAAKYLSKSTSYNIDNLSIKNKAFLQLAEYAFNQKKYRLAYNFYDSLRLNDPQLKNTDAILSRKEILKKIATQIEVIERQDSLQRIASLNEEERKNYVKKLVRDLRKQQGLKDEVISTGSTDPFADKNAPSDLFNNSSSKGEWYFYNASLRTKGVSEFKAIWGNRPNADNWRRISAVNQFAQQNKLLQQTNLTGATNNNSSSPTEITFDALYGKLPLTEEKLKLSNDSLQNAMHILGKSLAEEVEDCNSSITTLEDLRTRFPAYSKMSEVLFTLYYCYNKNGETAKASQIKKIMSDRYPGSPFTTIVTTGKNPQSKEANPEATKVYEHIYDLYIEGNFAQAQEEKKKADQQYGSFYWTPQLLYIESVYYIQQRRDSIAISSLKAITSRYQGTPLASKAENLIRVVSRRKEIEEELRNLNVVRPPEEPVKADTANLNLTKIESNGVKKQEETKKDVKPTIINPTGVPKTDSAITKPNIEAYLYNAADKHYVALFLNKVDPVWANEAKNAFFRYNREKYYNKTFDINNVVINSEYRIMLIGVFDNAQAAIDYVSAAKPITATQIIPWLKGDKYSYSIISGTNLDILKAQQDVNLYKQFLENHLPGKF